MSTIEQAAKRLEELRRAGIDIPAAGANAASGGGVRNADSRPTLERAMRDLAPSGATNGAPAGAPVATPTRPVVPKAAPPAARQGKAVTIDLARLAASGVVTPNSARSQTADEYRVIKRPLLDNVRGRSTTPVARPNLIMVTSPLPREGKTFTSINLAMSIAMELDTTVLLVDADVARPSLLSVLGLPPSAGLMELLTDPEVKVSEVLLRTNVEKLTLLPAGAPQSRATELLASQGMANLVNELATRYADRVILFDAPPLLATTESRVLATHMGQIVVVVQADSTSQGAVRQALSALQACPVVMTLLNKATRSEVGAYYGYGGYATAS